MGEELKPCPFCNVVPTPRPYGPYCETEWCPVRECDPKVWNTRPLEDALRAEVERLKDVLEAAKDILLYSREGGPDYLLWDEKYGALSCAVDDAELRAQIGKGGA